LTRPEGNKAKVATGERAEDTPQDLADIGLAAEELPADLEADFAPITETGEDPVSSRAAVDPFQRDSLQAQEAFDSAVALTEAGDESAAIEEYLRAAKTAEVAHEWYLAAVACQRVGDFLLHPRPPYDRERAFRMYRRAVAAYEQCGLFHEARALAFRQMCLKLRRGNELNLSVMQRLELLLFWATAGFGYRPLRVIGTAMTAVLLYAVAYWWTDGVQRVGWQGPLQFWHAVYFSGVTFATVGYGDFIPAPHVRLLALTEGFVGAFLLGLFVAVLANRLHNI
jgi:hypothetical protein